jgi:hypothetical protein
VRALRVGAGLAIGGALPVLMLAAAQAQVPVPTPPPPGLHPTPAAGTVEGSSIENTYGPPEVADLEDVVQGVHGYQKHHVRVRGVLRDLAPRLYLALRDGNVRATLIPMETVDYPDFSRLVGNEVEVTGIVRLLPKERKLVRCHAELIPESKCEDPLLPELPVVQTSWPSVSITITGLFDRGRSAAPEPERTLGDVDANTAAAEGKPVTAVGQFRGSNLCGDLPAATRRDPADWILLTEQGAVWVAGRRPEGKGFSLDPSRSSDTARWLEVKGKLEMAGEVRYLRATHVGLVPRPTETDPAPCGP